MKWGAWFVGQKVKLVSTEYNDAARARIPLGTVCTINSLERGGIGRGPEHEEREYHFDVELPTGERAGDLWLFSHLCFEAYDDPTCDCDKCKEGSR